MRVMLTRPSGQSDKLALQIGQLGIETLFFPVIEIVSLSDVDALQKLIANLAIYDMIIFISPAAVKEMLPYVQDIPKTVQLITVGKDTAFLLQQHGLGEALYPESSFNRNAMLALPELKNVANKKILLCQGVGGNTEVLHTLQSRGARVFQASVYQRRCPTYETLPDLDAIDLIQCTSSEGLQNLLQLLGPRVLSKKLLLSSENLCRVAKSLGFSEQPLLAKNAGDEAILHTLLELTGVERCYGKYVTGDIGKTSRK